MLYWFPPGMRGGRGTMLSERRLLTALFIFMGICIFLPQCDGVSKRVQKTATKLRAEAVAAVQAGDCAAAIEVYKGLLELEGGQTPDDYNNLGVCQQMLGDYPGANETFRLGVGKYYHWQKLHANLGSLLEEWSQKEWKQGRGSDNKTMGLDEGVWGPSVVDDESLSPQADYESTAFMARHLVKMGFNVELYANILEKDFGLDKYGVNWRPYYAIHGMLPPVWNDTHVLWPKLPTEKLPDVFISVNNFEAAHLYNSSVHNAKNLTKPASYLWMRSIPHAANFALLTESYVRPLHGIITLGSFHSSTLPETVRHCVRESSDAVEQEAPHAIRQTNNAPNRFVYAGFGGAGLELVLKAWPSIRQALIAFNKSSPEPQLEVIGAFTAETDTRHAESRWYLDLKAKIGVLMTQQGVIDRGNVSRKKFARILASAGFLLYPTSAADISSHEIIKAQLMGCIPITSRNIYSTLNETCGMFDLGPDAEKGRIEDNPTRIVRWRQSVIAAVQKDMAEEGLKEHREKMREWAANNFRWSRLADEWGVMFRRALEIGPEATCGEPIYQLKGGEEGTCQEQK